MIRAMTLLSASGLRAHARPKYDIGDYAAVCELKSNGMLRSAMSDKLT
jgi:hypothetical protein